MNVRLTHENVVGQIKISDPSIFVTEMSFRIIESIIHIIALGYLCSSADKISALGSNHGEKTHGETSTLGWPLTD